MTRKKNKKNTNTVPIAPAGGISIQHVEKGKLNKKKGNSLPERNKNKSNRATQETSDMGNQNLCAEQSGSSEHVVNNSPIDLTQQSNNENTSHVEQENIFPVNENSDKNQHFHEEKDITEETVEYQKEFNESFGHKDQSLEHNQTTNCRYKTDRNSQIFVGNDRRKKNEMTYSHNSRGNARDNHYPRNPRYNTMDNFYPYNSGGNARDNDYYKREGQGPQSSRQYSNSAYKNYGSKQSNVSNLEKKEVHNWRGSNSSYQVRENSRTSNDTPSNSKIENNRSFSSVMKNAEDNVASDLQFQSAGFESGLEATKIISPKEENTYTISGNKEDWNNENYNTNEKGQELDYWDFKGTPSSTRNTKSDNYEEKMENIENTTSGQQEKHDETDLLIKDYDKMQIQSNEGHHKKVNRLQDSHWRDKGEQCRKNNYQDYSKFEDKDHQIERSEFNQNKFKNRQLHYFEKYIDDKEFHQWLQGHQNDYQVVEEVEGDLFESPKESSLAHCVAEDMSMGSGIAVLFRQKFKKVDELLNQRQRSGGLAILEDNGRFVYYLVTKKHSTGKPTLTTVWSSLKKMKSHMLENNVTQLAIPRIGCGLDRLEWQEVKPMIEFIFLKTNVKVTVYSLQQSDDAAPQRYKNCKVVHEEYSIVEIAEWTGIIYLCSEKGEVTSEIEELDKKFNILTVYRNARKRCGDVIRHEKQKYMLYGFVVKKEMDDNIDFVHFKKCISALINYNKKDECYYIGIQAFKDNRDDIIMDKLINLLRNTLRNVEIYVCWPQGLFGSESKENLQ